MKIPQLSREPIPTPYVEREYKQALEHGLLQARARNTSFGAGSVLAGVNLDFLRQYVGASVCSLQYECMIVQNAIAAAFSVTPAIAALRFGTLG